jgi:acetyl-CoA carboxylase biotin carboxyl carrier protein
MSTLTYRDVVDVLNLLKESPHCASLDLELGDLKFSMRREACGQTSAAAAPAMKPAQSAPLTPAVPTAAKPFAGAEGTFIRAPLLGTFYRTLEPSAPPCVKVGDIVGPNDTVGLIEVMKLYTAIEAGVAGRIVEILAETGALVEYDQPLFRIEPA